MRRNVYKYLRNAKARNTYYIDYSVIKLIKRLKNK